MLDQVLAAGVISAAMAAATAWIIKWGADARTRVSAAVVLFLLAMMTGMLAGALVYFLAPSGPRLAAGLWVGALIMSFSVFPLFATILGDAQARVHAGAG